MLPDSACSSDLFCPFKEALGGKRYRTDSELKFFSKDIWTSNHKLFMKGTYLGARATVTVYRGSGRICRKIGITFWKKNVIIKGLLQRSVCI
jgi:hypothetical protein